MKRGKTRIVFIFLFLSVILISGCETAKGAAGGVASTVGVAAEGLANTAEGAAKDSLSLWQGILRVDDWIKKNLW